MSKCRGTSNQGVDRKGTCAQAPPPSGHGSSPAGGGTPCAWFANMIPNCLAYAKQAKEQGRPVVGIMCEYTPRELIMAAGAVPVCLCGGSASTIPAAEEDLPANLCPLIKSTYGHLKRKSNPFLEMADLIVAETTCDGKKKMYEIMGETKAMHVLELPQKPEDSDAFEHWCRELEKLKARLEKEFRVTITDCGLRQAVASMNRERALRRKLAEFMTSDAPPLTGRQLLDFKSSISGLPADFEQYEKAIGLLGAKRPCPTQAERVRVLMTGVPMVHGAEHVLQIVEDSGGLVVCLESCVGLKPILEDIDENAGDLMRATAGKYFRLSCSVMTSNDRRLDVLRSLVEQYRPQCVIELIWQACLTYDVETYRVKRLVEQELGLPYLRIETDYSRSNAAQIAVRVQALLETVRGAACSQGRRS